MKLGFHAPLTRLYVFVKNEGNALWYYLENEQKHYISEQALTCKLVRFEVKEVKTSFGQEIKADFEVVADRRYVLRSGIDTAFTKGMLVAIAALSDEQLAKPITIELKAGEEKGNVLVTVRDPSNFEFVRTGTWEGIDWDKLASQALSRLGSNNEPSPAQEGIPPVPSKGNEKPRLYPQNNGLIKAIRSRTKHDPSQIVAWCNKHGASEPSQIIPELCQGLVESMVLGWGEQFFESPELCKSAYDGKVKTLVASGMDFKEAVLTWMDSVSPLVGV